jgi:hypothetical protein
MALETELKKLTQVIETAVEVFKNSSLSSQPESPVFPVVGGPQAENVTPAAPNPAAPALNVPAPNTAPPAPTPGAQAIPPAAASNVVPITDITAEDLQALMRTKSAELVDNGAACNAIITKYGVTGLATTTPEQRVAIATEVRGLVKQ